MKKLISALVATVAISASATTYVTVVDCNRGESGTKCEKVTFAVRPASPAQPQVELVPVGEAGYAPAPKVTGGWLLKFLQSLGNNNGSAQSQYDAQIKQYQNAGGN